MSSYVQYIVLMHFLNFLLKENVQMDENVKQPTIRNNLTNKTYKNIYDAEPWNWNRFGSITSNDLIITVTLYG